MARAQARIFKTTSPAGWTWTFDRTDIPDAGLDNIGSVTAAGPTGASQSLDALKPLVAGMPGTLTSLILTIDTFEP